MTSALNIPVKLETKTNAPPSLQVVALLKELQAMLNNLINKGEASSIDVRSLPMSPNDFKFLRDFLGEGEVKAEVNVLGVTRIRETGVSGIWWVTHYNTYDEVIAELIEVTTLPVLLATQKLAVEEGLKLLEQRMVEKAVIKSNGG